MLRVVVDVNVLVSALLNVDGAPARVLRSWLEGAFDLVVSPLLVRELDRVTSRPGLAGRLDPLALEELRGALDRAATVVEDPPPARHVPADPKDDYLVTLAHASGAHAIVTGDAHLLVLGELRPPALDPSAFLRIVARLD